MIVAGSIRAIIPQLDCDYTRDRPENVVSVCRRLPRKCVPTWPLFGSCNKTLAKRLNACKIVMTCAQGQRCAVEAFRMHNR